MPHYQINNLACLPLGFPGGLGVKNPLARAGCVGSVPGWGRSPREGNGYPRQYSCLRNPTDRGASRATVHGSQLSDITKRINNNSCFQHFPLNFLHGCFVCVCVFFKTKVRLQCIYCFRNILKLTIEQNFLCY